MKIQFALIGAFASISAAHATPPHPCEPTIQARPTIISCSEKGLYYGIRIFTQMSDPRICPKESRLEIKTAALSIGDIEGNILKKIKLDNGSFTYTLSGTGDATFKSESESLDLTDCVTPMPGGFSVGN
jgi:hypothetical protein